jgi:proline iminopeptidase
MWEMMTAHLIQNNDNIKRGEDDKFSLASPLTSVFYIFADTVISIPFVSLT